MVGYEVVDKLTVFADYHHLLENFAVDDMDDSLFYSSHRAGVGVRYEFGRLVDLRAGVGLSDASDDFFAGAGLVVRL